MVDFVRWDGVPETRLRRPTEPGDFWRRAWVNAASVFSTHFPPSFRIAQDRGEGMIIRGGRRGRTIASKRRSSCIWRTYAGVAVRVQGLRRYYAVLLVRPNILRLIRMRDGEATVLAESPFEWTFETPYPFRVSAQGEQIDASVGGVRLEARDSGPLGLADGGVALMVCGGACSCDEALIAPPLSRPAHAGRV